jgi:hypothetical protein
MKTRFLPQLTLFALLLFACAPAVSNTPASTEVPATQPSPAVQPTLTLAAPTLEPATRPAAEAPTAVMLATSRGPELHATDPTTVSLASGGLQFVEFFRFT